MKFYIAYLLRISRFARLLKVLQILFVLFVACAQSFDVHPENCEWVIKVVHRGNTSRIASFISPGGSYFLRVQVVCNSAKVNSEISRYLVLTGVIPTVHVESEASIPDTNGYYNLWFTDTIQTVLVDFGGNGACEFLQTDSTTCYCMNNHPTCLGNGSHISSEYSNCMAQDCSTSSSLCNPAWLAPLPLREWVTSLRCDIDNLGVGPSLALKSVVFYVDGFHNNQQINTVGSKAVSLPQISKPVLLNCVSQHSPVCVITGMSQSSVVLYSSSEFADTEVIQVQGIFKGSLVCTQQYSDPKIITGSISILDTIIFNTPVGLIEVKGSLNSPVTLGSKNNVLHYCIKHLVGPETAVSQVTTVLAVGDKPHQSKIFHAKITPGKSVNFTELLDDSHSDACQYLKTQLSVDSKPCSIITASISSTAEGNILVLVEIGENSLSSLYHIMRFEGPSLSGHWVLVYSIPLQIPVIHGDDWFSLEQNYDNSSNNTLQRPVINGMSSTAIIGNELFLWGNMLLYSPHRGTSLQKLTSFPSHSSIIVFTSSFDGTYAFLTDTNELWVGTVGSAKILMVQTVPDIWPLNTLWGFHGNRTVVTMFFDSLGELQQVVSDPTRSCISRQHVPLQDIIASQNFHKTRSSNWKKNDLLKSSNNTCPTSTPQVATTSPINHVERSCPYAKMNDFAPRDVFYSRKFHYTAKPLLILNSKLVYSINEVVDHFTSATNGSNMEFIAASDETLHGRLLQEISLHRSESYTFELYLYLDYEHTIETSRHSWTLDHLRVSLYVSDPTLINVTSTRQELLPYNAVKYEVTVQDMGVAFTQHHPGHGLVPVSLVVYTWNSAFSCQNELNQGLDDKVLTVYLGCPANRQVLFDGHTSMTAGGQNHFCDAEQGVPCFLYELVFYPLFDFVDLATGRVTPFLGQYTLTIVGGGLDLDSIRDYSPQEQQSYNFKTTGSTTSLVWAAKQKSLATVPVFNRSTNGFQWLCGTESACANVNPKFMDNAQFYFNVEFSNRGVGDTNCDYTLRFIIRVHGLPPGSLHPSSIIVLSCLGIVITVIMTLFVFKRQDQKLLKKTKALCCSVFTSCKKDASGRESRHSAVVEDGLEMGNMQSTQETEDEPYRNRGIAWDESRQNTKDTSIKT